MDRFELNWPGADASFYTDGWRCRIVWRQKGQRGGGSMGGTIDNNQQCVKRAAESLVGAPYLLSALKARGHDRLADQIETAATDASAAEPVARPPVRTERRERRQDVENRPAPQRVQSDKPKPSQGKGESNAPQPVAAGRKSAARPTAKGTAEKAWLKSLAGDGSFEAAKNKRAKAWVDLGQLGEEALLLKAPAASGKAEWVLKRTWPDDAGRKAEYVVAGAFKGVASFLIGAGAGAKDVERMLAALADVTHPDLEAAARAWRSAGSTH